jgi:hypothetical protein
MRAAGEGAKQLDRHGDRPTQHVPQHLLDTTVRPDAELPLHLVPRQQRLRIAGNIGQLAQPRERHAAMDEEALEAGALIEQRGEAEVRRSLATHEVCEVVRGVADGPPGRRRAEGLRQQGPSPPRSPRRRRVGVVVVAAFVVGRVDAELLRQSAPASLLGQAVDKPVRVRHLLSGSWVEWGRAVRRCAIEPQPQRLHVGPIVAVGWAGLQVPHPSLVSVVRQDRHALAHLVHRGAGAGLQMDRREEIGEEALVELEAPAIRRPRWLQQVAQHPPEILVHQAVDVQDRSLGPVIAT